MASFATAAATTATAFRDGHGLLGGLGFHRPGRRSARSTSGLISRFGFLDPTDGGKTNRQSIAAEFQRSSGPSSLRATGFRAAQQPESVLELHLLPRRPRERRSVRAGRAARSRRADASPTGGWATSSNGTRRARSACSCGATGSIPVGLYHTARPAAAVDDARGRGRPDDDRRATRRARSNGRARSARRWACAPTSTSSPSLRTTR